MCDYSLANVKSRAASVGDKLVTKNFGRGTTGFADVDDQETAVCVRPGTELAFAQNICGNRGFIGFVPDDFGANTAIFRQINKDEPHTHHDMLELPDGQHILLTRLQECQHATVLQLPAEPKTEAEAKEQERAEFVG